MEHVKNFKDLVDEARQALNPAVWDFLEGGAGEENAVANNRNGFRQWNIRPRILAENGPADLTSSFMGVQLAFPVITAPFGADGLFHPQGQLAVSGATEALGVGAMAPHVSTFPMERIREVAPSAASFFQLHPVGSEENFLRLANRAKDAGFRNLVVTADCPTAGYRDRVLARQFIYEDVMGGNYEKAGRWTPDEMFGEFRKMTQKVWGWDKLGGLMAEVGLPFCIKGVMIPEDAVAAVEIGATGILVSNHGGRQLDCTPGTVEQLPSIVEAVGDRAEVILDGGIRRGTDVVKAVALGAKAVVVGRLAALGLAAGGQAGVERALRMIADEMVKTLELMGCGSVAELGPEFLQPSLPAPAGRTLTSALI
jgi:4-hydroxymandelate oxidase